ncbi:3-oxoacyl-ACP reductase [Planctomycetaceae bacterium SCGC AG-212-F19]|nr:3-oxoacyl-ACP reductase [Planctomycetaceae bacterium SCGC AG-212-F19]
MAVTTRLTDKVAIVFGAGSCGPGWGNGKATAVAFAREGAKVVAVDRHLPVAEETCGIIRGEGGTCVAMPADVTRSVEVAAVVQKCVATFGRIDILHNNVGIAEVGGPVEASEESWDRVIDVNVKSMFLTCKHVLPVMGAQRAGVIINISSIAGIRWLGVPYVAYAASKAAVNQLTVSIALQYADQGIRANAILPGLMNTPMIVEPFKQLYGSVEEMIRQRDAMCPMKKMGDAWDVANAAVFLASEEAKYITGVLLPVDGGLTCKVT